MMLDYGKLNYNISSEQKYLVVRGTNLSTSNGDSYLWWLNGTNKSSSVVPAIKKNITIGDEEQTLIAWDMSTSGINDNLKGDYPIITLGQTIFGMTSTSANGYSEIYDINFVKNINEYETTVSIQGIEPDNRKGSDNTVYDLSGRAVSKSSLKGLAQGIYIIDGKKVVIRN